MPSAYANAFEFGARDFGAEEILLPPLISPQSDLGRRADSRWVLPQISSSVLLRCLFAIIVIYAYFIHISQGSVETHLRCGGIFNNCIIANCPQSVSVKEFRKWSLIGEDMDKSTEPRFSWPTLYIFIFIMRCTYGVIIISNAHYGKSY